MALTAVGFASGTAGTGYLAGRFHGPAPRWRQTQRMVSMTPSGSVSDFRRYKDAVHKYEQNHLNRRPRFVTVRYDLLTDWKPDITIPCAADKGVYAFFNKQEDLLYVGKASHSNSLGNRICSYFYADTDDQGPRPRHPWTANGRPRYALITATYHAFEAPSLEEYLIQELQPPENSVGRKRSP